MRGSDAQSQHSDFLRHAPTPGVKGFAILTGIEASLRGILVSVWPLVMYRALDENAASVSLFYFVVGVVSLFFGLMVPWISRYVPRRWVYTGGVAFYLIGSCLAIIGADPRAAGADLHEHGDGDGVHLHQCLCHGLHRPP